jgi:hypothetical protein
MKLIFSDCLDSFKTWRKVEDMADTPIDGQQIVHDISTSVKLFVSDF